MVKPFIAILSLGLGAGAAAALVVLQSDPTLLTSRVDLSSAPLAAAMPARPLAPISAVADDALASGVVRIGEVTVYGTLPRRQVRAAVVHAIAPPAPAPSVIAPPCVDGQYRELEEHRGVRLMCFGSQAPSQRVATSAR